MDPSRRNLPDIRAFQLSAYAYTARAENAAIVIENETGVRHVDRQSRIVVGVADVGYAQRPRQRLQLAMTICDTC